MLDSRPDNTLINHLFIVFTLLLSSLSLHAETNQNFQQRLIQMAQQSTEITQQQQQSSSENIALALKQLKTEMLKLHTKTLQEMVALHGWPTALLVGKSGVNAAAVIVKNSEDLAFQQDMLPLMIQSYLDGEGLSGKEVAELTDQVSLKLGKKQVFGTQYDVIGGNIILEPIENEASVNRLRQQMGLTSLDEFLKNEQLSIGKAK